MTRFLLLSLALPALLVVCPGLAQANNTKTLVYTGAMQDGTGRPVGGIFAIRFGLHQKIDEPKLIWSEDLFIAIEKGTYQVELGKERPIPQTLPLTTLFLSVQVDGVEIQRVPVAETMVSGGQSGPGQPVLAPTGDAVPSAQCTACMKAQDSEKLAGMTLPQLLETLAKKQVALGSSLHMTEAVGNKEGDMFFLTCPPGYVVTGIKGSATDSIRSAQLVCSPLENK